jgi:hypothetical protein
MFIIINTKLDLPRLDPYGHIKVYTSKAAAKQRANSENNALTKDAIARGFSGSKIKTFSVAEVALTY